MPGERTDLFDVAIVGAGSAGCAFAGRLATETDLRVALLEAGPDYGPWLHGSWPADLVDAHNSPDSHDWGFEQSRARVVGGCSAHNECALVRALPGDYDRWNVDGWRDAELTATIDRVWRVLPTRISEDEELGSWSRRFLAAALDAGFARHANAESPPGAAGVAPFIQNVKDGIRWNAAFAFLDPARSRVTVLSSVLADRLVIEKDRAQALMVHRGDEAREIRARHFVLCAGAFGSPAILLRSGVGPLNHLRQLNIPLRQSLPGVGANLHDHPGVDFDYELTRRGVKAVKEDVASGRFYEVQIVLKPTPDLHVIPYQSADGEGGWSFGIVGFHVDPRSRGRLSLTSCDPAHAPQIDFGMLSDRHDLERLSEVVPLVHDLTRRTSLAEVIARGPRRFSAGKRHARFVRDNLAEYSHPAGTCRMGPSARSGDVVDSQCRVYGLENVFVADASIIPRSPRANTNLTCFVIGSRAAELLGPSLA